MTTVEPAEALRVPLGLDLGDLLAAMPLVQREGDLTLRYAKAYGVLAGAVGHALSSCGDSHLRAVLATTELATMPDSAYLPLLRLYELAADAPAPSTPGQEAPASPPPVGASCRMATATGQGENR